MQISENKLILNISLAFVILLIVSLLPLGLAAPAMAAEPSLEGRTIILDPGHGGSDPGSTMCSYLLNPEIPVGEPLYEKDVNLDVAERLGILLSTAGADVHFTRTDDTYLTNADRYNEANRIGGNALVSIHHNGSTTTSIDGYLSLYAKRNKDMEFAQIMHDTVWPKLRDLTTGWSFTDYGVRQFASGVLLKSKMPATIQESVFISNTMECLWLRRDLGVTEFRQQQIANALYLGLIDWFEYVGDGGGDEGPGGGPKCEQPPCDKVK